MNIDHLQLGVGGIRFSWIKGQINQNKDSKYFEILQNLRKYQNVSKKYAAEAPDKAVGRKSNDVQTFAVITAISRLTSF